MTEPDNILLVYDHGKLAKHSRYDGIPYSLVTPTSFPYMRLVDGTTHSISSGRRCVSHGYHLYEDYLPGTPYRIMGESYSEVAIIARMVGFVPFKIRTSAISRFLFLPPYVDPWEFENDLKEIV